MTFNLLGCWLSTKTLGDRTELVFLANELVQITDTVQDENPAFLWLGLRNQEGTQTPETRAIEDYIVASLVDNGIDFIISEKNEKKWSKNEALVEVEFANYSIGGRLIKYGDKTYVRLFIVDENSIIVDSIFKGVSATHVEDEVEARSNTAGIHQSDLPLNVDLHWILLRDEGGIRDPVVLEEGSEIESGDQLQIRYRISKDAKVFAFLFSNEGGIEPLVNEDFMYSGLLHFGPTENGWIKMAEKDRVYTAYFLAGPRLLEENKNEFIQNLQELIDQGLIHEFTGLSKQDQLLADFISRAYESDVFVDIIRGPEVPLSTRQEVFVYSDGTRIKSYAELLKGTPLIIRAVSFRVQ